MQTIDFYFASLALFFAFSGTILVVLWHIRQVSNGLPKNGFLFLSLAMFTLSLSAIHYFLSSHENDTVKVLIERILSSVGNMFLALSLPYFVFGYGTLSKRWIFFQKKDNWNTSIVLFFSSLFVLFSLLSDWKIGTLAIGQLIVVSLETFISAAVLLIFGYCLGETFRHQAFEKAFRRIVWSVLLVLVVSQILIALNQLFAFSFLVKNIIFIVYPAFISFLCFATLVTIAGFAWFFIEQINTLKEQKEQTLQIAQQQLLQLTPATETTPDSSLLPNNEQITDALPTHLPTLKIGYNNQLYFFELSLPKCNLVAFRYENYKIVNGFLFLLFYAFAKKNDRYHDKNTINGYSIAMFNNTLIQALNTQLTDAGYEKITKEDLLFRNRQGKFELVVDPKQIVIVGLDQIKKESDSSSINSILSILDM
ncbi:MAG: hypothetical protein KA783_04745 [Chitinophagales bacterium]|nr:hypothetical protein [Chitinophagales bacterium]